MTGKSRRGPRSRRGIWERSHEGRNGSGAFTFHQTRRGAEVLADIWEYAEGARGCDWRAWPINGGPNCSATHGHAADLSGAKEAAEACARAGLAGVQTAAA